MRLFYSCSCMYNSLKSRFQHCLGPFYTSMMRQLVQYNTIPYNTIYLPQEGLYTIDIYLYMCRGDLMKPQAYLVRSPHLHVTKYVCRYKVFYLRVHFLKCGIEFISTRTLSHVFLNEEKLLKSFICNGSVFHFFRSLVEDGKLF